MGQRGKELNDRLMQTVGHRAAPVTLKSESGLVTSSPELLYY